MKAIIDILKDSGLYTFMSVKESLLERIHALLAGTEYSGKYGLSGSFANTDQTISIVVGILSERQADQYVSSASGGYYGTGGQLFREYTYGINVTGINDEEVLSICKHLYYGLIRCLPSISRELRVKIGPEIFLNQITPVNPGSKRMWSNNMYVAALINEVYPPRVYDNAGGSGRLDADGYEPPEYSSCVIVKDMTERK